MFLPRRTGIAVAVKGQARRCRAKFQQQLGIIAGKWECAQKQACATEYPTGTERDPVLIHQPQMDIVLRSQRAVDFR